MRTKRKIVHIDEELCDGCGKCVPNCAEGALEVIDGKVRLIKDIYCDGLGACLGECPTDAITVTEKKAEAFDEHAVELHLAKRAKKKAPQGHACPSSQPRAIPKKDGSGGKHPGTVPSELRQWPIQLTLLSPQAPYLQDADLLLTADCVPFACGDFHNKLLKGKALVIGCPKLDDGDAYIEKITEIIAEGGIKSLTVVHMEVPCCFGLSQIASVAAAKAKKGIPLREITVSVGGDILEDTALQA